MPTNDSTLANAILLGVELANLARENRIDSVKEKLAGAGFENPEYWLVYVLKRILSFHQYTALL